MTIYQFKYVQKFQCDGSKCNAKCCKKWRIDIDQNSYNRYKRIKDKNVRNKILNSIVKVPGKESYAS